MAKYSGIYSCGHEGVVNIIGPLKDREWKRERIFSNMCPECYKECIRKQREEANKKASEQTKEMELPQLEGTEKQIAWANTLRIDFINKVSKYADEKDLQHKGESKKAARYRITLDYIVKSEEAKKASYWIDLRYRTFTEIIDDLKEEYKGNFGNNVKDISEREAKAESTIEPSEVKYDGIVEIIPTKDKIEVKYEKNEDFRSIVKDLGYAWNNGWSRNITELTGSYIDRAAELGNKLLNAGLRICIMDNIIREKAINADYEIECNRWVRYNKKHDKLALKWSERNQDLYDASRKLPGSKWDSSTKSVLISMSHYKLVEEFADMYGFNFSKAALEAIEEYKEKINNAQKVSQEESKEKIDKNGLEDILNSSRDILDDLREED